MNRHALYSELRKRFNSMEDGGLGDYHDRWIRRRAAWESHVVQRLGAAFTSTPSSSPDKVCIDDPSNEFQIVKSGPLFLKPHRYIEMDGETAEKIIVLGAP